MRTKILLILLALIAFAPIIGNTAAAPAIVPVVLISIDGLKPDHVLEADKHG